MPRRGFVSFIVCALVALVAPSASAREVGFRGLGDLPGGDFYSIGYGISGDGTTVVGESRTDAGREPFVWSFAEGMLPLDDAPIRGRARSVSGDGSVVVGELGSDFRWTREDGLGPYVPAFQFTFGVSADGATVVGRGRDPATPGSSQLPLAWTEAGGLRALAPLPNAPSRTGQATAVSADGSVVVGSGAGEMGGTAALRWEGTDDPQPLGELPGGDVQSIPKDVSPDGSIVVGQSISENGPEAFVWTEAEGMRGLGDLPGPYFLSLAVTVNDDGAVLGRGTTELGNEPFLWTEEDGMRTVQEILDENGIDTTGWTLFVCCVSPAGMSDDGLTISGTGRNPQGEIEAWIAVLPPPPLPVPIDIQPGHERNRIRLGPRRRVPVALFGSDELPVDEIDEQSLAFGPEGAEPVGRIRVRDLDRDGLDDLLLFFRIRDAGLAFGDTEACIEGETLDGLPIEGCDAIEIVTGCGKGHLQSLALAPALWLGGRWRRRRT